MLARATAYAITPSEGIYLAATRYGNGERSRLVWNYFFFCSDCTYSLFDFYRLFPLMYLFRSFTDAYGVERKAGDEWLVHPDMSRFHVVNVHETFKDFAKVIFFAPHVCAPQVLLDFY